MIPQHLSLDSDHPTPAEIVEASRLCLGSIDLDPASSKQANETVQASRIFTPSDNGLTWHWEGRVFLNPPGGQLIGSKKNGIAVTPEDKAARETYRTRSRAVAWWRKLCDEYLAGRTTAAIFVGFNLDILQASQGDVWPTPLDFAICVPASRLEFSGPEATHGNVIVYLGPDPRARFERVFSVIGAVKI